MHRILEKVAEMVACILVVDQLAAEWHWALHTGWPILATYLGR